MDNPLLKKNESLNKKKFPDPKQFTNLRPEETALSNHQDQEKNYDLTLSLLLCNRIRVFGIIPRGILKNPLTISKEGNG